MRECVRGGAVQRHFGSNTNAHHHKAQLVVQTIGQNAAQIVFNFGKENWKQRHHGADINQYFSAGKAAGQSINSQFGGKGREDDRAGDSGSRVAVLQPIVQKRKSAFHPKG